MALNASGPISLAGTTAGQSIALELSLGTSTQISLNDTAVRTLAGVASGAITMPTNFWGKSSHIPFSTKVTYTSNSTFTVPSGISVVRIKAWGGAGGRNAYGGNGGAAGFARADIVVTPANVLLIAVGGGGVSATNAVNGGGKGTASGGGYSGVFINNLASVANTKIIAGGGGGKMAGSPNTGGFGGGLTGATGGYSVPSSAGVGGTQTTGFAQLQGGNGGGSGNGGGGGGGGWWGGRGGTVLISDGGGGSGYVTGTNTLLVQATLNTAGNSGDVDYVAGKGVCSGAAGATTATAGNAGYVVLYW
jgi:hypothetical protein